MKPIIWKVYPGVTSKVAFHIIDENDKEHPGMICEISKLNGFDNERNAYLIASSPQLLRACLRVLENPNMMNNCDSDIRKMLEDAVNNAVPSAIQKSKH